MIVTKYLGPTNHRGSRIKATGPLGSVTVAYDSALDNSANYDAAAAAYVERFTVRPREFVRAVMPDGCNYAYIATVCPKVQL